MFTCKIYVAQLETEELRQHSALHIVAAVGRHVVGIHQGAVAPYKEGLGNFQLDKVEHSFFIFVFLEKDKKEGFVNAGNLQIPLQTCS